MYSLFDFLASELNDFLASNNSSSRDVYKSNEKCSCDEKNALCKCEKDKERYTSWNRNSSSEGDDYYELLLALPCNKEDVKVNVENDVVHINYEHKWKTEQDDYVQEHRRSGAMTYFLPSDANPSTLRGTFNDDTLVLKVNYLKKETPISWEVKID